MGAVVAAMSVFVLVGGGVPRFGMVLSVGVSMLSSVTLSPPNMVILVTPMSIGPSLQKVPKSSQHLHDWLEMLAISSLLPAAVLAVALKLVLPGDTDQAS